MIFLIIVLNVCNILQVEQTTQSYVSVVQQTANQSQSQQKPPGKSNCFSVIVPFFQAKPVKTRKSDGLTFSHRYSSKKNLSKTINFV